MQYIFPRVRYLCQLKLFCVLLEIVESGTTSRSDQPAGISACPQRRFFVKLLTPKDGGSFILTSLTNISHQVSSRSLIGQCFECFVCDETM